MSLESIPAGAKPSATLATSAYEQLRADLLAGRFRPGEKLRAELLRTRYNTGSSPIREALNRLLAEGFVLLEEQKGFRVAPISKDELRELVKARCWIDGAAIRESVASGGQAWEEGLVLAYHRLSRASRWMGDAPCSSNPDWERLHRAFHTALVSGCGSRWMCRFSEQLFDKAERYRLLACARFPERNEREEHHAILEACLDRNADEALRLLGLHYSSTLEIILGSDLALD